jgi:hypothetical protein
MSMEMLKIYQFIVSEQHANVDGNINVDGTCKCQWKCQKYIDLSFPLGSYAWTPSGLTPANVDVD